MSVARNIPGMHADVSVKRSARQGLESLADGLLRVGTIYHEPDVPGYARVRELLAHFPNAHRFEVPSHWKLLAERLPYCEVRYAF